MFSIHCKVLRVDRQKKEESILVQNRREEKTIGVGTHNRNPLQSLVNSPLKFRKNKIRGLEWPDCSAD